jgi:hypothetical protein
VLSAGIDWLKQIGAVALRFFVRLNPNTSSEPRVSLTVPIPWTFAGRNTKRMSENQLILKRHTYTDKSTIGDLLDTNGESMICYTLEDTVRRHKEAGITAIPAGRYEIIMQEFGSTGREYPYLLNVPFYTGIFIHGGNTAEDSQGCILVGLEQAKDRILDSQRALNNFVIPRVRELLKEGRLYLTIVGGYKAEDWENG